ncbi:MAG: hypothetical protein AVDCRST_MAG34-2188 [uncultured Nocardioidaceae bacterium]|uniref:Uncharacterized protein n=1 Tax=uncultured Nocardioidaceae bacterium TaxID=253824 RepID=A0A6J4MER1_9ACTN|nr:MAG: hypothetical protein AVDCRST_MAG34-2188 [uncultured Nocardioidaceae bacterium]
MGMARRILPLGLTETVLYMEDTSFTFLVRGSRQSPGTVGHGTAGRRTAAID